MSRSSFEPGTRSMSPKEQKMTSGSLRDRERLVDHLERGHADRATRPMDQLDLRWQEPIDPVFHDRVGLAAADFHQDPGLGDDAANFFDDFLGERFVAIFVEIFHATREAAAPARSVRSGGCLPFAETGMVHGRRRRRRHRECPAPSIAPSARAPGRCGPLPLHPLC